MSDRCFVGADVACDGSSNCPAAVHIEGCFATMNRRDASRIEALITALAVLDEQNVMLQDYLRQIRDASTPVYMRGLAIEALERSR